MALWCVCKSFFPEKNCQNTNKVKRCKTDYDVEQRDCRMMLLNCQSLTGNKADYLASEFDCERSRVGFLCLTETNVSDESIKFIHFPGFTEVSSFNRTKHKSGGVGLWARDDLDCHSLNLKAFVWRDTLKSARCLDGQITVGRL